ncbi:HAMP domain-containing sensor histidine kinase [Nocardioides sp.]|uniref:sensor histidine kinase n=1 Tax=Nocardioides sp. TaxID=35761 RepID=UPI002CB11C72|nr:HAMP domain-containing sensor histidine kinase [Nocardioides sp.]HXH78813.1 HAMP domain-containing sensor histidine kinase [Nocardioides sp.]
MSDDVAVVMIALAWSGGVALVGLVAAWLVRSASLRWQSVTIALTAVLAVVAGVIGTARAMFLSAHDFAVVLWVCLVAGLVAATVALVLGSATARWSRSLAHDARRLGDDGHVESRGAGPAEFRDVSTELTLTSRKLAESRERERRLEESRRELVSWVSHDLRTPLAGMRAMTEALEDGLVDDPARYLSLIRRDVERMVRLVDDLFELSRIHAGVLPLNVEAVALADVVSEAIAGADREARAGRVRLGGQVDPGLVLQADPGGLSRVVTNLVDNAVRHTPADGAVEILGRANSGGIELIVSDGCGGLSGEDLRRVFDVGWQGSSARTPDRDDPHQLGQAGLGLAIVKGIVEAHGGQVTVANHDPGCRFVVLLPDDGGVA